MVETTLKKKTLSYINQLDEQKVHLILAFARSLTKKNEPLKNSKTEEQKILASKALNELEKTDFHLKTESSMDGRSERAEALWKKYESLS